jgi:NADP-dependent 3-hydroxy acid dehydrogenase YdfG
MNGIIGKSAMEMVDTRDALVATAKAQQKLMVINARVAATLSRDSFALLKTDLHDTENVKKLTEELEALSQELDKAKQEYVSAAHKVQPVVGESRSLG